MPSIIFTNSLIFQSSKDGYQTVQEASARLSASWPTLPSALKQVYTYILTWVLIFTKKKSWNPNFVLLEF